MTVPITSDLYGYTAFWNDWLTLAIMASCFGWSVIVALLSAIAWKLWRG